MDKTDAKKDTTSQIADNLRYYGEMRFKQLTLLLGWFTVVGAAIFLKSDKPQNLGFDINIVLANASVLICAVLWIMEIRSSVYWDTNQKKVPDLWLKPKTFKMKFLNATNAVLVFYISTYAFWTYCIFIWQAIWLIRIIVILIGILLIIYSVINYLPLWKNNFKK